MGGERSQRPAQPHNSGVGGFNLPSEGYNDLSTEQTLQVGDTQIFGTKVVNETRFQFYRSAPQAIASSSGPAVMVSSTHCSVGRGAHRCAGRRRGRRILLEPSAA